MIDFSSVTAVTIPEGDVTQIAYGDTVLWQKDSGILPAGYKQVDYIRSASKAYLNLGAVCSDTYTFTMSIYPISISTNSYSYYMLGTNSTTNGFNLQTQYSSLYLYFKNSTRVLNYSSFKVNNLYDIIIDKNSFTINSVKYSFSTSFVTSSYDFYLFSLEGIRTSDFRMYSFKITDASGNEVMNLIPCLDGSGVACAYDTVSETTFYSASTSSFVYGSVVT